MHNNDQQSSLKRRRNHNDDSSDFLPLSKRINSLKINNPISCDRRTFDDVLLADYCRLVTPSTSIQNTALDTTSTKSNDLNSHVYNPSLDAAKNPFYYKPNQLLFELYVERSFRRGDYHMEKL